MKTTLFTELTLSEQENLSGGVRRRRRRDNNDGGGNVTVGNIDQTNENDQSNTIGNIG